MRRKRDADEDGHSGLILTILLLASLLLLVITFPPKANAQYVSPGDKLVAEPAPEPVAPVDENGLPTGHYGYRHSEFHEFYDPLYNNNLRVSCCHARDCRPTQSRVKGDHYEVMINGVWMKIEKDHIIKAKAPDGGAHVCTGEATQQDPVGRIYCVVLPPEG